MDCKSCNDVKGIIRVWGECTLYSSFLKINLPNAKIIITRIEPELHSIEESTTELLGRWFEDRNILICYH